MHLLPNIRYGIESYPDEIARRLRALNITAWIAVAGIVGTRKFFYDVWGDAVNVAARMESTGTPGAIQVSQAMYEHLREEFVLEDRGPVQIKGKGIVRTWFLVAAREIAPAMQRFAT